MSCGTQVLLAASLTFMYRAVTVFGWPFHAIPLISSAAGEESYNPACAVWALPRSLAATEGISFDFFSSGYLDVSVPQVR